MMGKSVSEIIAEFTLNTTFESIGKGAVTNVKRAFLDSLGVMIAGSVTETSKAYLRYLRTVGALGPVGIELGEISVNLPILDATALFAIWLHALDYDDTGAFSQGHPSSTIFPVVYALRCRDSISNSEIFVAYTIGVEVLSRLSRAMPMMHLKGWHPTGTIGTIASAVTAARLLKLNRAQVANAIGIAASTAAGMVQNFGTMTKPLHAANAVSNGLRAAMMAKEGFTSNVNSIDGRLGFINAYYGDGNKLDEFLMSFSGNFVVSTPGINFKRHASCALTHRSIDGVLEIMNSVELNHNQIETICCYTSPRALKVLFYNKPTSELEAKFSMHFVLAVAAIKGDLTPKQFSSENLNSKEVKGLMEKVELRIHEDWSDGDDWRADRVVISFSNGDIREKFIQFPKGNAALPLTWDELVAKFEGCCEGIISSEKSKQLVESINNLEHQTSGIGINFK